MRESRTSGSVRGGRGNPVPYRDNLMRSRHSGRTCAPAARSRDAVFQRRRLILAVLGCIMSALGIELPALADAPLRVCLQADDPPLSSRGAGEPGGFDVALAARIADRLDRPLAIQWFTTRDDPDSNPVTEADALLSDGHCVLVAGYPLVADKLGRPRASTGKLPPFEGAKPEDRRRWINLGEIVLTRPNRFDSITVVLSPTRSERPVQSLADLRDLETGVEVHGLPDLIAMTYREGQMAESVVRFDQSGALFAQLESGVIDAALIGQRTGRRLASPAVRMHGLRVTAPFGMVQRALAMAAAWRGRRSRMEDAGPTSCGGNNVDRAQYRCHYAFRGQLRRCVSRRRCGGRQDLAGDHVVPHQGG
jgi:ABC-type amino acid transport substrate-binding protein